MAMGALMGLAALAAACMGDPWEPWALPMEAMDPAWEEAMGQEAMAAAWEAMAAACMGSGPMGATTATDLAWAAGDTWERLMELALCQVLPVRSFPKYAADTERHRRLDESGMDRVYQHLTGYARRGVCCMSRQEEHSVCRAGGRNNMCSHRCTI